MSDKYFIDTNIFIYAFDQQTPGKNKTANDLIKIALSDHKGCISFQVVQEFLNVATRKFKVPLSFHDSKKYLENILSPLCEIFTSIDLYNRALDIMERWQYSFYDSLIISAAIQANCNILFSEDLQHKQKIQSITILNPFLEE